MDIALLKLINDQQNKVRLLEAELAEHEASGNEYYAAQVRDELVVAQSPARLIHKEGGTMVRITYVVYRVKDSTQGYVWRRHGRLFNRTHKGPGLTRQEAHHLLADWLDCGYEGKVVRSKRTKTVMTPT